MTSHLLEEALKKVPTQQALVNIVSKRVRQLNQGERPLVDAGFRTGFADIALQEIIEGKLTLIYPATDAVTED
ncbi:MAG: DNA-directed RNA polymerase subunit omega [Verrucomicrobia bacterium]|jgi:DNA-directed RNA polymerase subunit omega|nr:MAG: DNA-directed RNA polymerase subunit omega [Verrucomicrobiota bacterium]